MVVILYEPGLNVRLGFDTIRHEVRPSVVQGGSLEVSDPGQLIEFHLEQITKHEELQNRLEVSASAAWGNELSGGGSVEAKFVNSRKIETFSLYLLASVTVLNPHQKMLDLELTSQALNFLQSQGEEEFRQRYGDSVIIGKSPGGRFFSLLEINTTSSEEKEFLEDSLRVSGSVGTWSGGSDFKSAIEHAKRHARIHVYTIQAGGSPIMNDDVDGMINKAINFPEQVRNNPVTFKVELMQTKFILPPTGPNEIDVEAKADVLRLLSQRRSDILDALSMVEYVLSPAHQNEFIFTPEITVSKVNELGNKLRECLDEIRNRASLCRNDIRECVFNLQHPVPEIILPERKKAEMVTVPHWNDPEEAEHGFEDDWGTDLPSQPSASEVGLRYTVVDQLPSNFHGSYEYVQEPDAGMFVPKGSLITLYKRV